MAKSRITRWWRAFYGALNFWAIVPPGILAVVGARLSTGVAALNAWGPFGWFFSGLAAFAVSSVAFALIARTKLWRVEAKSRARTLGDSSEFDPMASVYENKRLYLRDLAPLGRRQVRDKMFINCEIIGPGTAVLGLSSTPDKPTGILRDCNTFDVDCIEVDPTVDSMFAIGFWDCTFTSCNFYHMSLLFGVRENDSLHWITKDSRQGELLSPSDPPPLVRD